ncbi:hypothetical protein CPB86DRAFT_605719 [Serendipita vermifera]|nr:hypothetical protein CPB86DRAFT_605719 [Serendipita vermifera]
MSDSTPTDQPLPEWMSYSLITNADGNEEYTIVTLPLTYYGPSIPLGTDDSWTYGGESPPPETPGPTEDAPLPTGEEPPPEPEPTTVFVTVTPEVPTMTETVYIPYTTTVTVTVTATPFAPTSPVEPTQNGQTVPPNAFTPSSSLTSSPSGSFVPAPTSPPFVPSSSASISNTGLSIAPSTLTPSPSASTPSTPSALPSASGSFTSANLPTGSPSSPPSTGSLSGSISSVSTSQTGGTTGTLSSSSSDTQVQGQPNGPFTPSPTVAETTIPESVSALPSVTGTARTYLGLAPNVFLGVILAIIFSLLLLLCCLICWIRHRRRRRRRELAALPPPTSDPTSRLLAGDRDPTREDLAYPYSDNNRELRRSQIAMMRARGELDDEWDDRLQSPSMRSASIRLPEDDVGTTYSIRERALAAAGVGPPYGYHPVPRNFPSIGTNMSSITESGSGTAPTVTPATANVAIPAVAAGAGALPAGSRGNQPSPSPHKKDTGSTDVTNDSSAIHMYASGGRSRMDSAEGGDPFFYHQTSEGEVPSPVASSSDFHFLQRNNSNSNGARPIAGMSAGVAAGAVAGHHTRQSSGSSVGSGTAGSRTRSINRTRNLEELYRAAMAYPESPVSDTQESARLMPEHEQPGIAISNFEDEPSGRQSSRSTRESGLSRWMLDRSSSRGSQQPPILQRMLQKVLGSRNSSQRSFSIIPSGPSHDDHTPAQPQQYYDQPNPRVPSRDFSVGGGLLFPRPPVHTGYSSASTARDDMRAWGGLLPWRLSSGTGNRTPMAQESGRNADPGPSTLHDNGSQPQPERNGGQSTLIGRPILPSQGSIPLMRERAPTPGSIPLLGFGLRPPPPSAYPLDRSTSGLSSGRSTVYYDARSTTSTPLGTLNSHRDRAADLQRYDSPPPQPVAALRSAQSAQSLQSYHSLPLLPPGIHIPPPDQPEESHDILDAPPPMPTRDVRQARSLNTILSVGTQETYDTANPPLSLGQAFAQDERARYPPPGLDPAPRAPRSVPSDIAPSEAADADLGAGYGSIGRASSNWRSERNDHHGDDLLEEEPPMAASQWRVLASYPRSETASRGGSVNTGASPGDMAETSNWRLTLGQPVIIVNPRDQDPSRLSHYEQTLPVDYRASQMMSDSYGSRASSNRTNVSHSRDIHSLQASEVGDSLGSNGSKGSNQTRPSISEYGQIRISRRASEGDAAALLSAVGSGPEHASTSASGLLFSPSSTFGSRGGGGQERSSPAPRPSTPPSAPVNFPTTPGIRLIGAESSTAGTSGQGPASAPTIPTRGWPTQTVPRDVTPADGRRPSESQSFIFHDSPALPRSRLHSHSPSAGAATSTDHSHSHATHGAETTMGTMTEATTEDYHEPLPDIPPSLLEHIFGQHDDPPTGGGGGEPKVAEEEDDAHGQLLTAPAPGAWLRAPRWQNT